MARTISAGFIVAGVLIRMRVLEVMDACGQAVNSSSAFMFSLLWCVLIFVLTGGGGAERFEISLEKFQVRSHSPVHSDFRMSSKEGFLTNQAHLNGSPF